MPQVKRYGGSGSYTLGKSLRPCTALSTFSSSWMQWELKALSTFWDLAQNNCFQMGLQYLILVLKQLQSSVRREGWHCYEKKIRDFVLPQQRAWTIALWFRKKAQSTSELDSADLRWICVFTFKLCLRSWWERISFKITTTPSTELLCRMIWDFLIHLTVLLWAHTQRWRCFWNKPAGLVKL